MSNGRNRGFSGCNGVKKTKISLREQRDFSFVANPALNFDWFLRRPDEAGGETLDSKMICLLFFDGTNCGCQNFSDGVKANYLLFFPPFFAFFAARRRAM